MIGSVRSWRRAFLFLAASLAAGCATIGYPLRPDTIRNARQQPLRLGVALLEDSRPIEEVDWFERARLIGEDDAKYYTDFNGFDVADKVSDVLVKHLVFAGAFREVDRVELATNQSPEFLKSDIKKLSADFDAVLLGKITHFWAFDGYNAEGDRRIVEAQAHLAEIKIVRTRDFSVAWAGQAITNVREVESTRKGNQYRIANETLRESINKFVADLNKTRLSVR